MATTSNRKHHHAEQKPLSGMADTARKNYEHAIRTGEKFQEEAGQWWTRLVTQTATTADWQRTVSKFAALAGTAMPVAQKCFEGTIDIMEKGGRSGVELMKKAVDASQTPGLAECQAKWMDFWTCSMKAAQSNIEAVTQLGTQTIDSWIDFVRENSKGAESRVGGAA